MSAAAAALAGGITLDVPTPAVFEPLLAPARYKGAKGGRGSGKSHFFAELAVEEMLANEHLRFVCIREVQRSLKFSAKSLIERKIRALGVSDAFTILTTEIRRNGGTGVMIFEGMQDHTADTIKSLDGFHRAWVEEAQSISARSLKLLIPTIREPGSELWFSWNPDQPTDPIDEFLVAQRPPNAVVVHANYTDNPFCPVELLDEAARLRAVDADAYEHVWLGAYDRRAASRVLAGKWVVEEFTPQPDWDGPYHGADFGFAQDPNALVRCWIAPGAGGLSRLMVERESYALGQDIDAIPAAWTRDVPDVDGYVIRADSARPETISYLARHGFPKIAGVEKWSGSVEDGIAYLRQFDRIVIHPACPHAVEEARLWSYKVDRKTGDVLPEVVDKHNHVWDAVRYALAPLIRRRESVEPLPFASTYSPAF